MCNFEKDEIKQTVVQATFALRFLAKADNSLENSLRILDTCCAECERRPWQQPQGWSNQLIMKRWQRTR